MRFAVIVVLSVLATLLHNAVLRPGGPVPRPDLPLLLVMLWTLTLGLQPGLLAACLGGLLADSLSAAPFGLNTAALLLVVPVAMLRDRELVESRLALALLLSPLATGVYYAVSLVVLQLAGWPLDWGAEVAEVVVPAVAVNTLLAAPLYVLIALIAARLGMPYGGRMVRRAP